MSKGTLAMSTAAPVVAHPVLPVEIGFAAPLNGRPSSDRIYAVAVGRRTGIFDSWAAASRSTLGYSCAVFKSFPGARREEAREFVRIGSLQHAMGRPIDAAEVSRMVVASSPHQSSPRGHLQLTRPHSLSPLPPLVSTGLVPPPARSDWSYPSQMYVITLASA